MLGQDKKLLSLTTPLEKLSKIVPNSFEDVKIGDPLYFFILGRNQERNYQRTIHHFAIKYSKDALAHVYRANAGVKITSFKQHERSSKRCLLLTKSLIEKLINDQYI